MSIERPDLAFAVKELCRMMSNPIERYRNHLPMSGKFLTGMKRVVQLLAWHHEGKYMKVFADSNFGGCNLTKKSTS